MSCVSRRARATAGARARCHAHAALHRGAAGRKRSRRPPSLPLRAGRRRVETTSPSTRRSQRSPSIAVNACRNADINECLHQDWLRRRDATRPTRVRARRLRQGEGRVRRAAPATRSSARYFLNEQCARAGRAAGPSRKSGSRAVRGHSRRAFWPGLVEERSNNRFQERSTANPALACVWPTSA